MRSILLTSFNLHFLSMTIKREAIKTVYLAMLAQTATLSQKYNKSRCHIRARIKEAYKTKHSLHSNEMN